MIKSFLKFLVEIENLTREKCIELISSLLNENIKKQHKEHNLIEINEQFPINVYLKEDKQNQKEKRIIIQN